MTQPTVDKARAALDDFLSQYRQEKRKQLVNDLVNEAADELKTACPDHGSSTTCFMRCQCDAGDVLRRMAEEAHS